MGVYKYGVLRSDLIGCEFQMNCLRAVKSIRVMCLRMRATEKNLVKREMVKLHDARVV